MANEFLERVAKPIYTQMLAERKSSVRVREADKRNYDDYNEGFWRLSRLQQLATTPQAGALRIMSATPSKR